MIFAWALIPPSVSEISLGKYETRGVLGDTTYEPIILITELINNRIDW